MSAKPAHPAHGQPARPFRLRPLSSLSLLLLLLLFLPAASAVSVAFENCLSDNYRNNKDPVLLQWVPLLVEASFDTKNETHGLTVTMFGNVTGSLSSTALPAWNSSLWQNDSYTDGKILEKPEPDSPNPKLTTLHSKVDVLTYEPFVKDTDFCNTSLTNAECPLGPVFNTTAISLESLPAASLSNNFYSTYAFTSFAATFIIRYGNDEVTTIGCVSATITPDLGNLAWLTQFLPLLVLVAVGFATVFAAIYSPWGSTNIFLWTSNYGRDPDLLRLVTPGFGDCLQYIQFVVLTGSLTLNYPGFYQPVVSQAAWSALLFNESFISKADGMQSVVDGIYYTNGTYGLQNMAQLVGMAHTEDIWAGMMVWLLAMIAGITLLFQLVFGCQWLYRVLRHVHEEDLRKKNWPFSIGNVIRIVFNYFLLPLVALSAFQLVVASQGPAYVVALAVVTIVLLLGFAIWLLRLIISTKPRAVLFDDLPTLLIYGPLYNTYSDEAAAYAPTPIFLTMVRGIAIGAVQPAGIAQIVLLAICEVIQILTLHAFRPFHTQSSMNAYHTLFSLLRFVTIMLMIAFIPTLDVTEGPKGWVGYVILLIHACVLIFGFFLNAIQAVLEVIARMAGAGGDDITGQTRGGLSKIFGMRQLSRRMPRRSAGAVSRQSQLSSSAMLYSDEASKGGRQRSESAGSIGILMGGKPSQRSSSALDNLSLDGTMPLPSARHMDSGEGTPTTMGDMSTHSYLPSPTANHPSSRGNMSGATLAGEPAGPYYRPPRRTRKTTLDRNTLVSLPDSRAHTSWTSADWAQRQGASSDPTTPVSVEAGGAAGGSSGHGSPAGAAVGELADTEVPYAQQDYTTREIDFYYGVRGERLNSDAPGRKLGTGPADPTGPMASAAGWLRGLLGGKSKDKGKGFEVVRSARMPHAMKARGGDFEHEGPPPGIPVAMNVIRHGPIESDDEEDAKAMNRRRRRSRTPSAVGGATPKPGEEDLLDENGDPSREASDGMGGETGEGEGDFEDVIVEPSTLVAETAPELPDIDVGSSIHMPSRLPSRQPSRRLSQRPSRHQSRASRQGTADSDTPALPGGALLPNLPSTGRSGSFSLPPPPEDAAVGRAAMAGPSSVMPTARLPFDRNRSTHGSKSSATSTAATPDEYMQVDLHDGPPGEFGYVQQGNVGRVEADEPDLLGHGHSAEIVDGRQR